MLRDNEGVTTPALRQFCVLQAWFLLPLVLLLCCLLFLRVVTGTTSEALVPLLQEQFSSTYTCMRYVSAYGNKLFYGVYALLFGWALWRRQWGLASFALAYLFVQVTVTVLLVQGMKVIVGRARPYAAEQGYYFFSTRTANHSLPSGHTAEITGATGALAQRLATPLWSVLLGLFPAIMGLSRIVLREHHMLDVFVGALVGSFSAWCMLALAPVLMRKVQAFSQFRWLSKFAR